MAVIEVSDLTYVLPNGRVLLEDVGFRVGDGEHAALIGANGTGKTTLLRVVGGDLRAKRGAVTVDGHIGMLRQFVADDEPDLTVRDYLVRLADQSVRAAAAALDEAERAVAGDGDEGAHLRYADALAEWGDAGGYDIEALWDACCDIALRRSYDEVRDRPVRTFSGGEQKRLALEALFRSSAEVLLLDEPDNFLDLAGKAWLEGALTASAKTILLISHDRALLARTASKLITVEAHGTWTHGGAFATYAQARRARLNRIEELGRRYSEEHARLTAVMKEFKRRAAISPKFASRAQAAETRLKRFERDNAPPERAATQQVRVRVRGGRTGKRALLVEDLAMPGIFAAFSTEILFGERVGILGPNGTGKSHFLRLVAGEELAHTGRFALGARVEPGLFSQLHDRAELHGRAVLEVLMSRGLERGAAMAALSRYELRTAADDPFDRLSGGQQARVQILLLEIDNPTMLMLDEPTDNLDLDSAEALEAGLDQYEGTVMAVTHDRWFMRVFDRYLIFERDGQVRESLEPLEAWTATV